jgi:hypothetical protein
MFKIKTLPQYRHPSGIMFYNCKALYEDGRLVVVEEDHALFEGVIAGLPVSV